MCSTDTTTLCDNDMYPTYSSTGMTCNIECTYPEFNFTSNDSICRSGPCEDKKIMLNETLYACIDNLNELKLHNLTNSSIWNETSPLTFDAVSECYYTGSIHNLVCNNSTIDGPCDTGL